MNSGTKVSLSNPLFDKRHIYQLLAESIGTGIIMVDNDDVIQYINEPFCRMLGYKAEELCGRVANEALLSGDNREIMKEKIRDRKNDLSEEYEICLKTSAGKCLVVNIIGYPVKDSEGKIIGSLGFHKDITKRKRLEEDYNKLINNIREGFFSVDMSTFKPIILSPAFTDIYGFPEENFYSNPNLWFERIHPDDQEAVKRNMEFFEKGESSHEEHRIIRRDGKIVWVEGKVTPTLNEQGKLVRIDGVIINVTDRKKIEQKLQQKIADLETLVSRMSHDIRAPLSSILGLVNLAQMKLKSAEEIQYIEMIRESVKKLDGILRDLTSAIYIAGKNKKPEQVDPGRLIDEAFSQFKFRKDFDRIKISTRVNLANPFHADRKLVYSILQNLIDNAIKYKSSDHPAIDIHVSEDDLGIKIEVADNGIGIPPEYQSKIFDMFFRGTESSQGSGLGLYIVKAAVEKLHGKIQLTSQPGKGTCFTVFLPDLVKYFASHPS